MNGDSGWKGITWKQRGEEKEREKKMKRRWRAEAEPRRWGERGRETWREGGKNRV